MTSNLVWFMSKLFSRTLTGNCIFTKLMIKVVMCINCVERVQFYYGVFPMSRSDFLSHWNNLLQHTAKYNDQLLLYNFNEDYRLDAYWKRFWFWYLIVITTLTYTQIKSRFALINKVYGARNKVRTQNLSSVFPTEQRKTCFVYH
jgi:hypothetical protein